MLLTPLTRSLKRMVNRFKADVPPDWWVDSRQLNALIQGSWNQISEEFLLDLELGLRNRDIDRMEELLSTVESLGPAMSDSIGDRADAIFESLQNKAVAAWTAHGQEVLSIQRIAEFGGDYRKFLSSVHAEQLKRFTETNPGRILHPEIERQISYLRDNDNIRTIDLDTMAERLERIVKQEPYWEGLTDVQVSRLWHADGIMMASQNGVVTGTIIGPDDQKTCPVCQRMLGTHVNIEKAKQKIEQDVGLLDPDAYVKAWPFPRTQDIDNISPEARAEKGYLPPFHSRCRHSIAWLY